MAEKQNRRPKKPILRIVSLVLAVTILCTALVTQYDTLARFAAALAEQNPLSRIYDILEEEVGEPQTYDDYYQLANIAIGQGNYDEALTYLDECEALVDEGDSATLSDLHLRRASLYMLLQNYADALVALNSALEYNPESSQALLLRAQVELTQEAYIPAASDLESYLNLVPDDASVRQNLAQVYEAMGRYADASECYEAIYAQYPQESLYHLDALRCQMLAGEYETAREGFDAFIQENEIKAEEQTEVSNAESTPSSDAQNGRELLATAYFLRACCQMQFEDYAAATADFESAIRNGYDEGAALEQLVTCSYVAGEYEAALAYGERLLALPDASPALGSLYQQMGASAMVLERYEEVVEYFTQAIECAPELVGSYYYRGISLLSLERYEEAVEDFTRSIEEGYLVQFCYYNRGVCYVQMLDYESALDDMEMTLSSGDEQSLKDAATNILWQLAQYYENQRLQDGEQVEAEEVIE